MTKNILLLFLSDVKVDAKTGRVVTKPPFVNIFGDDDIETTNESAVRYLKQKNISLDKIFIFASEHVREPIKNFEPQQTHLDFFIARVKKFFPNVDCKTYCYTENVSADENLRSVAEMAGLVQKFAADDETVLHVDLTGGMRDVNIMMLDLTRLLEYSGLTVGSLLYSNLGKRKVEDLQNIYDIFQLIAGVEEFVNFGSVKALNIYYGGKKISAPLENLLSAMKKFAEEIKLCHYDRFLAAIQNLHDAVRDFEQHAPADVEDFLMARLIGRIRKNYRPLIANRDKDDLRVIGWCLDHDYIQQALTLCTERLPEYLGEKNFMTLSPNATKLLSRRPNRWFYLFSKIEPQGDGFERVRKKFCSSLKDDVWESVKRKRFDFDAWAKNFGTAAEPRLRSQLETLARIFKEPQLLDDLDSDELEPLQKLFGELSTELRAAEQVPQRLKILKNFLNNLRVDNFSKFFDGVRFLRLLNDYPRAQKIYRLLDEKFFLVNVDEEKFLSIVDKYFRIKNERNGVAHAFGNNGVNVREFTSADELRRIMREILDDIEKNLPAR